MISIKQSMNRVIQQYEIVAVYYFLDNLSTFILLISSP